MKRMLLAAAAALVLGGFGLVGGPASAAVSGPVAGITGANTVEKAQMTRRDRMMRHRGMRHRGMRHRAMRRSRMMRSDPNARNPSRPGYQQQRGTTSGGPRY
jgi:hypothetical protein